MAEPNRTWGGLARAGAREVVHGRERPAWAPRPRKGEPSSRRILLLLAAARSPITGSAACALAEVERNRGSADLGRLFSEGLIESKSKGGPLLDRKWKVTGKGRNVLAFRGAAGSPAPDDP